MDDKLQIYIYTLIIDITLVTILFTQKLSIFDKTYIYTLLITHLIFYYALKKTNKPIINILHYSMFLYFTTGLLLSNKYMILLCISVLILIQILWIINKECILNNISHIKHGYNETISFLTILITFIYFIKLIKIHNLNHTSIG